MLQNVEVVEAGFSEGYLIKDAHILRRLNALVGPAIKDQDYVHRMDTAQFCFTK